VLDADRRKAVSCLFVAMKGSAAISRICFFVISLATDFLPR
jgi:hypothetical protein